MLGRLPNELLFWICKSLEKSDLINLILFTRSTKEVISKALYRCLQDDTMPIIYRAVLKRRLDIAQNLLTQHKEDVNSNYRGNSTLCLAIKMRYPEAVDLLLQHSPNLRYCCDFSGRGALSLAVVQGQVRIAQLLLLQEIDINDRCSDGISALMYAIYHGQYYILQLLLSDDRTDVNLGNYFDQTPIQLAVQATDILALQLIAQHPRVDINRPDSNGDTPLIRAAKCPDHDDSAQMVESLLLNSNLDLNDQDSRGRTALWHAVDRMNAALVQILLSQKKVMLNIPDRRGITSLARAAAIGSADLIRLLLRQPGICINSAGRDVPPLWLASCTGRVGTVKALLHSKSIQIGQRGPDGLSPLQVAVARGHGSIVSLLMARKNGISAADKASGA